MPDLEKVIKGLECCWQPEGARTVRCHCTDCPYCEMNEIFGPICRINLNRDALELLKEQPEIVRCKDCKYYEAYGRFCRYDGKYNFNRRHQYGIVCHPDWFCADGERRNTDA